MTVAALLSVSSPQASFAACGHEQVTVTGTPEEVEDACRALDQVLAYFEELGFKPELAVSVSFRDQVYIDMYEGRSQSTSGKEQVSGFFNRSSNEVQITSGRRSLQRMQAPWGIEWRRPIAYSILQHELVHVSVAAVLGSRDDNMGRAWHEFIAYAVQFDVMDPGLRERVTDNYPRIRPFQQAENINPIIHAVDPDAFGIRAYLLAKANGGPRFIKQILMNEIDFSTETLDDIWTR